MAEAYIGPGVEAEVTVSPTLVAGASVNRVAYFTGTGSDTLQKTVLLTRDATSYIDELDPTGTSVVSVYPLALYPPYAASQYELTGGNLQWIDTTGCPAANAQYYVSYVYNKSDADYTPKEFTNIDDFVTQYGAISTDNPLSIAASLCFDNGTTVVGAVQIDPDISEYTAHKNALALLEVVEDAKVIVPIYASTSFATAELKPHVLRMSTKVEKKYRVGLQGLDETTEVIAAATWKSLAEGLATNRVGLVYPGSIQVTLAEGEVTLDGTYLAAAIAGIMTASGYDAATPITGADIAGIVSVQINMNNAAKDLLAGYGVMIVDMKGTQPYIRHGLTTDMTTVTGQEITVTTGIDQCIMNVSNGLAGYTKRTKSVRSTPGHIAASFNNLLRIDKKNEIITDFRNDTAFVDPTEPRRVICRAEVYPVFGVNWVTLQIVLNVF